jgi:hypothetical protein
MAILSTVIMLAAIGWVIVQLLITRRRLRNGEIDVPPLFATTLVFFACLSSLCGPWQLPRCTGYGCFL